MEQILNNHNLEAEQAVLAAIIQNNDYFAALELEENDFLQLDHQKIFKHIAKSLTANLSVNPISLRPFFETLSCGKEYLSILLQHSSSIFAKEHAKHLRELSVKRQLATIGAELKENACDEAKNAQEIKDALLTRVEELNIKQKKETISLKDAIRKTFDKKEIAPIYYTGYKELDDITGGFEAGDLVILAGRPSMGKSAMALNIAMKMVKKNPVLFISLEMSVEQVSRRIIANLGSLNVTKLKYNNLTSQHEVEAFQRSVNEADNLPIYLNDFGELTLNRLKYEIKKYAMKGVKLVVIDYIQLINHHARSPVERVTAISNALKAYAMELGVIILGLSQLSRAVEARDDKRPQLSDLRESGSIEQDANSVIFTFRPEYYLEREKPEDPRKISEWENQMQRLKGLAYAIVAKNRDGRCGEAKLRFDGEFARFSDETR
jgi:replicative DNA helicase